MRAPIQFQSPTGTMMSGIVVSGAAKQGAHMEHQRAKRLSWLATFVTAVAIAIGMYMAGTVNDSPGNPAQGSVQTQPSTAITSASNDDEGAIDAGAQGIKGDTAGQQPDAHQGDRSEPEEMGNED